MKTKQVILSAALLGVALTPLQGFATSFVFDNNDIAATDVVNSFINFSEGGINLKVTAGVTNANLFNTTGFSSWTNANVFQDLAPINGGLGVDGWGAGTDNFEGSVSYNNSYWDEILFFDFNEVVSLVDFNFNGSHTPQAGNPVPRFSLYSSSNGTDYTSVFLDNYLTSSEVLTVGGVDSRYFALGAAAPTGSRTYVEALSVNPVPEPTTMLLFGTGLIGLAGFSRRKRK